MAFEEYKNLWVFIETEEGKAKPVGYELLTPGRRLADANQEKLVAVVIGKNVEDAAKEAEEYGADEVILVDEDAYYNYNTDAFSDAMEQLIKKYKPSTVLIGATNNGRDMGPRLSCRLGTGLTADCTDLSVEEETGNFLVTSLLLEDGTEVFPQTPEIPAGEPIELPPSHKPKKLIKKKNK